MPVSAEGSNSANSTERVVRGLRRRFSESEFLSVEALSGVALLAAAATALVWVNIAAGSYNDFWNAHLTVGRGDAAITETLRDWVNDGLMSLFFFVVGLEIKRELVRGELRDQHAAGPADA